MSSSIDLNFLALTRFANDSSLSVKNVKVFLENGFDVNYVIPAGSYKTEWIGNTALHLLVMRKSLFRCNDIFKLLCSGGANYLKKNKSSFTPLRLAYETCKDSINNSSLLDEQLIDALLAVHLEYKNATNPHCSQGISHFHIACLFDKVEIVQFFLDNGASINETIKADSNTFPGCTGLHLAIHNKCKKTVILLLNRRADCLIKNAEGKSPLHLIVEKLIGAKHIYVMKENERVLNKMSKLIANVPNTAFGSGLSHLHVYCTRDYTFKMKDWQKLLDAGVDLNAPVHHDSPIRPGYTPMHFAALCNLDTVILLLQSGANPFAKDVNGLTPLDLCFHKFSSIGLSEVFNAQSALQSIGFQNKSRLSDVFAAFDSTEDLTDFLKLNADMCTARIPLDSPLWPGWSILHLAVELTFEYTYEIERCLEEGASFIVQDANGMTALHKAFYMEKKKCIKVILTAHYGIPINCTDKNGLSHFHIACITGGHKIVKMFLSNNVDPNITLQADIKWESKVMKTGSTPLHIAAIEKNVILAKLLLTKGADPCRLDVDGFTWIHRVFELHTSCCYNFLSLSGVLRSNPITPGGLSYLHIACCSGNLDAVKALLPLTANVNTSVGSESTRYYTKRADTPLHLTVTIHSSESVVIVDLLLKNGADIRAKDSNGLNPLQLSLQNHDKYYSRSAEMIRRLVLEYDEKQMWPDDIGLTKLHVACFLHDLSMIRESLASLESEQSVNSRMKSDSPLWPGEAPLNLLIKKEYPKEDDAVKLVLRHIIQELENEVKDYQPLHESAKRQKKSLIQSNFVVNNEGLTAVHISCMGNDVDIVESLLRLGVDFYFHKDFSARQNAGFYPLHFSVKYGSNKVTELLLNYKVNVDRCDSHGNTAIHLAALKYHNKLKVFARANALDIRTKNLYGKTVLDLISKKNHQNWKTVLSAKFKLIARLAQRFSGQVFKSLVKNIPTINDEDSEGRNIFHHLKYPKTYYKFTDFLNNIKSLISLGCDLDHQDKEGQTALHHGAKKNYYREDDDGDHYYENYVGTVGIKLLLLAGADLNIVDSNGKTPLYYCTSDKRSLMLSCLSKLLAADLHINKANEKFVIEKSYSEDLDSMKQCSITDTLTLRHVLTEKLVMKFPMLTKVQQSAIYKYLYSDVVKQNFDDWRPVFNLQYRKALKAKKMYKAVVTSLRDFVDPRLPGHCLDSVLLNLSLEDWKNITLAANTNQ